MDCAIDSSVDTLVSCDDIDIAILFVNNSINSNLKQLLNGALHDERKILVVLFRLILFITKQPS